ncbi:hypothetical protein [Herbaspirillum aquaticum]|jgi:hypothetical protein|uniref:hypothetical protein n=1 Tax=Herbaspirillum aquaticum TaxID=568783 RepID=UPI0024DE3DBC|nr:hypothetical protein [Herbaspirillum aquaticum]
MISAGTLGSIFGAFMTICRIKRNNAEQRIAALRANDWQPQRLLQRPKQRPRPATMK